MASSELPKPAVIGTQSSVARPTNVADRDAQIEHKLRLYGIFSAFGNKKFPNNKQIDVAMNSAVKSDLLTKPSESLSKEGQDLTKMLRSVVEQARVLFLTKNSDEHLQKFLWYASNADASEVGGKAPISKETAKQHGQDLGEGLKTLGRLIITNGQFRKLLSDASILFRDMAADAASSATQTIRPDEEKLNQIDEPAPDHTWHDTPPKPSELLNSAKSQLADRTGGGNLQQAGKEAAGDVSEQTTGKRDPKEAANTVKSQGKNADVDAKGGAAQGAKSAANKVQENVDTDKLKEQGRQTAQQAKETAVKAKESAVGYLKEKVPEERRDQTVHRLRKMVVEIQQHDDYDSAIDTLISLAEQYFRHGKNVTRQVKEQSKDIHESDRTNIANAEFHLKTLLENFANYSSLDDIGEAVNVLLEDANKDPELDRLFNDWARYLKRCLKETGYVLMDSCQEDGDKLYDRSNKLLRVRYRDHTDRLADEFKQWFLAFGDDPENIKFGDTVQRLLDALGTDKNGKVTFKPHLLKDVANVIIPDFFKKIGYVPIPRIEVSDPNVDVIVENLVLESENLMPKLIELQTDNLLRFSAYQHISNHSRHSVRVYVSQIQCDLKDVAYYIKKKIGFPSLTDKGVADFYLGGEGLSFNLRLSTALPKDQQSFFKVDQVDVVIKNLDVRLKESSHKLLFGIFRPLLLAVVRPAIAKVAEIQIRRSFDQLDREAYGIHKQAKKAIKTAVDSGDPQAATNVIQSYLNAIQQRYLEMQDRASDTKVCRTLSFILG